MLQRLDLRAGAPASGGALPRPDLSDPGPVLEVRAIVEDVRRRGDAALRECTARFDKAEIDQIAVSPEEIAAAPGRLNPALLGALSEAARSIESFHRHRAPDLGSYERNSISVELLQLPVARAGVYVPGGLASYPSSVLMSAIPARVAGVEAVAVCVPPRPDGSIPDEVLAAARLAAVDELYRVGGAQAIAAMAYGTESLRRVDVIVGPGSRRVSLAKLEVKGRSACRLPSRGPPRSSS